uniref:FERM domain-containing protein n=1 Tax=Ditylenchus dipsaci TaxID=166011 RepID=A0A915E1P5_9BILA
MLVIWDDPTLWHWFLQPSPVRGCAPPAPTQPSCSTQPVSILRKRVNFMGIKGPANSSSFSSNAQSNSQTLICTVHFLDDTQRQFEVQKNATGEDLINQVFSHLELMEKDFFGLQFISLIDSNCARMRWLDSKKSIKRQIVCPPYQLFFGSSFMLVIPADWLKSILGTTFISKSAKTFSMAVFYAHLRMAVKIVWKWLHSWVVSLFNQNWRFQCRRTYSMDYLNSFQLLPIQSDAMLHKIAQLHQLHIGQSPAESEFNFLAHAKRLPMYGFDLHEAKDGTNHPITIGVNSNGVSVFENRRMVNAFPWAAIIKLSFKRKTFFLRMKTLGQNGEEVDTELSFNAICPQNCKILWKSCIEHHTFFRLIAPPIVPNKSLFNLGSKFRYSGRTEFQTMQQMKQRQQKPHRSSGRVFHRPLCYTSSVTAPTPPTTSFLPRPSSTSSQTSATPSNSSCHTTSTKLQNSLATEQMDAFSNQLALPMVNSITSATTSGISTSSMAISCTDANVLEYELVEYSLEDDSGVLTKTLRRNEVDECTGQAKLEALECLLRSVSCSCSRSTSPTVQTTDELDKINSEECVRPQETINNCTERDEKEPDDSAAEHFSLCIMSSAITMKKNSEARFGWPPPSNKYSIAQAPTKPKFIDTFHAHPPPSYNSVVRNATKSGNKNGSVGSLSSTGSSQPKLPQKAESKTDAAVVAQASTMSLLPSVLYDKPLESGSKSISSSSISQIPVLASGKAKLNHGVRALMNAKDRRSVNKSQSLEPKGCNERVVTFPTENGDPRAIKGVHPSSTSSSTCSCSSSPTQDHVPSPNTNNLQRRYSITIGSNCDPNHRSNNTYECDVDDIFSASDSEAAVSGSLNAMSSRARLRRRVEMGAALDGLPPPSGLLFNIRLNSKNSIIKICRFVTETQNLNFQGLL